MSTILLLTSLLGFGFALALVPAIRWQFRRWGFVDKPDRERKLHASAVSLGGGLAVFAAVGLALGVVFPWLVPQEMASGDVAVGSLWAVLIASLILLAVGLYDDLCGLNGIHKLIAQFLVATMVVASGTVVQRIGVLGFELDLGIFAAPLTVVWLLAAINAINLIDGADAMAGTASASIALAVAVIAALTGVGSGGLLAAALGGAVLGFLVYNRPPASIYLGDAGSMVIGLVLGVSSLWVTMQGQTLATAAPLALLSLPIFDATIAFLRRKLTGRSIYAADRGHLHHRLMDRFTHKQMLLFVAVTTAGTGTVAIASVAWGQPWIAVVGTAAILGGLVASNTFGKAELRMLLLKAPNPVDQVHRRSDGPQFKAHTVRLQGVRDWEKLWKSLAEFACDRGLVRLQLDICVAWKEEGFHGSWARPKSGDKAAHSTLKLPVYVDDRLVGRMDAVCDSQAAGYFGTMQLLLEKTEELGAQIKQLLDGPVVSAPRAAAFDPAAEDQELAVATTRA